MVKFDASSRGEISLFGCVRLTVRPFYQRVQDARNSCNQ
jgi:hypothetical protein